MQVKIQKIDAIKNFKKKKKKKNGSYENLKSLATNVRKSNEKIIKIRKSPKHEMKDNLTTI